MIFSAALPHSLLLYPMIWNDACSDAFFTAFEMSLTWVACLNALEVKIDNLIIDRELQLVGLDTLTIRLRLETIQNLCMRWGRSDSHSLSLPSLWLLSPWSWSTSQHLTVCSHSLSVLSGMPWSLAPRLASTWLLKSSSMQGLSFQSTTWYSCVPSGTSWDSLAKTS